MLLMEPPTPKVSCSETHPLLTVRLTKMEEYENWRFFFLTSGVTD
jgi:hypothetical protein